MAAGPKAPVPQQPAGDDREMLAASELERQRSDRLAGQAREALFGETYYSPALLWAEREIEPQ